MSNNSICPFYVGQEVVAIRDSKPAKRIKRGDTFIVKGLIFCHEWNIDVGFNKCPGKIVQCDCGHCFSDDIHWVASHLFAPIIRNFQSITFEKVIEQELASVN